MKIFQYHIVDYLGTGYIDDYIEASSETFTGLILNNLITVLYFENDDMVELIRGKELSLMRFDKEFGNNDLYHILTKIITSEKIYYNDDVGGERCL